MEQSWADWCAGGTRVAVGGHHLFVRQDGDPGGVPVTLVHGFPTCSHDWSAVVPALVAAGLRVTTLDLLGLGASDKPRRHAYSVIEQADLVEGVWRHLGIGRTALVAHDYGVSVAQELLAREPDRITSMAWLNGGVYPDLHRPVLLQRLMHSRAGLVLGRLTTERTFRAVLRSIMGRPVVDDVLRQMWLAVEHGGGARVQHALLSYIDERRAYADRWRAALESYAGPTQVIWGPADPISGGHVLPRLRERLPHAAFVVLDEAPATGHFPQVENPGAVGAALAGFLAP